MATSIDHDSVVSRSSSQVQSVEYLTMRKCTSVLIDLVKSSLSTIGPAFFAEEYIGETTRDLIGPSSKTSDVERAQILVDLMTDQVRADPSMYMKFITLLEKEGPWVELFLKNIKQTYSSASLEFRLSMSCDERSDWLSGCGISATTVSHFKGVCILLDLAVGA